MATTAKPKRNTNAAQTLPDPAAAFIAAGGRSAGVEPAPAEPDDLKKPVMIRFDPALLKRVDAAAKKRGVSRSAWVQFMLSSALDAGEG